MGLGDQVMSTVDALNGDSWTNVASGAAGVTGGLLGAVGGYIAAPRRAGFVSTGAYMVIGLLGGSALGSMAGTAAAAAVSQWGPGDLLPDALLPDLGM